MHDIASAVVLPVFPALFQSPTQCSQRSKGALTLCTTASAAGVPPHGNGLLLLRDVTKVGQRTLQLPSIDSLSGLAGVLEGDAKVAAASPGGLCVVDVGGCVADLFPSISTCSTGRKQFQSCERNNRHCEIDRARRAATYHLVGWAWISPVVLVRSSKSVAKLSVCSDKREPRPALGPTWHGARIGASRRPGKIISDELSSFFDIRNPIPTSTPQNHSTFPTGLIGFAYPRK